ncbi:hypothetical protein WOLCODRAFT_159043 [Wolfiporia cocos MD-104 SS10]|uniref:Uncharacterized protein n=1 Tax=Wolfiporia cocos (strain MD-104) TaxID=742152 RepID=A0A2H3JP30_WOLCO|nr:hypothetical protein WOLCODRAFT_159043 [Wolfiporia cocos MD-104 SS10]
MPNQRQRMLLGNNQTQGPRPGRSRREDPSMGQGHPIAQRAPPPDSSGSDKTTPVNGRTPAEGHTARVTTRVIQTQPHATATSPLAQPAVHQVEQRRRRFTKRATPSADHANSGLASQRRAVRQQPATGSRARPKGTRYPGGAPSRTVAGTEHQARRQGPKAQVFRHQAAAAVAIASPGKAYQRQGMPPPLRSTPTPPTAGCIKRDKAPPPSRVPGASAAVRRQTPSTLPRYSQGAGGGMKTNHLPIQPSQESESAAQRSKANDSPPTATDAPGTRRRHRLSSKCGGQEITVKRRTKRKSKYAPREKQRARWGRPPKYTAPRWLRDAPDPSPSPSLSQKQPPRKA